MYRLLSIFSITLGLLATSVASAQQRDDKFIEFPKVKVRPIDFQQVFTGTPGGNDELLTPPPAPSALPAPRSALAAPVKQINQGLIVDERDSQQAPVVVHENEIATACSEPCCQCNQSKPCSCKPKGGILGCIEDCWHDTCIYRAHVRNLGHPCLFCERPLGVCHDGWYGAMIMMGKADRAVMHHYDFTHHPTGTVVLTTRGHRDLQRIAGILAEYPVPLTIESTDHPRQDQARRLAVVNAIAAMGLPISPDSIRVSPDEAIGLSGEDAQAIHSVRTSEVTTGASRTRPFRDASNATIIPILTGESSRSSQR